MLVCRGMVLVLYVRLLCRRSGSSSSNCCEVAVAVADDITGELLLLFSDDFCTCRQKINKVNLTHRFVHCFVHRPNRKSTIYFLNSVQNQRKLTDFSTRNPEEISHKRFGICPPHLRNVTVLH